MTHKTQWKTTASKPCQTIELSFFRLKYNFHWQWVKTGNKVLQYFVGGWVKPGNSVSFFRAQELCESHGGHPGLQFLINLWFLWLLFNWYPSLLVTFLQCACACLCVVCEEYNIMSFNYPYFWGFNVCIFADLVKHIVLTILVRYGLQKLPLMLLLS